MSQSRAVLTPSFVESYGLPVAEAPSLGTPVIASDITVQRESAGGHALFVDPLDSPGLIVAICTLAAASVGPSRRQATSCRPPTWRDHLAMVANALAAAAA